MTNDHPSPTPRTVLVTGGSRGIGLATAKHMASLGHRVAITHRSGVPDNASELFAVECDVTSDDHVAEAFTTIADELGPVDVLVSNAGVTRDSLVLRMGTDDFSSVLDANLTGGFRVARHAVKAMMKGRWGRVVFVSSVVGTTGQAGQANYAASKAGLVGLSRSLAREFASRNITVNVVAPGPIKTDMTDALTDDQRSAITENVPLARFGSPDEVASAIAFLCSEQAAYITGAVLPVDGGLGMGA